MLVLLVTVLAAALVANFARIQDRGFETESARLMQSALDERARAVANQAWDYGNWDDAYRAITVSWDQEWLDSNYFTSIADGLVVFRPGEAAPRHVWLAEGYASQGAVLAAAATEAARAQLDIATVAADERPIHSGRMVLSGRLALFSVAPVRMMDGDAPESDYVVIIEILEPDEIAEIGAARDLEAATFTPGAASARLEMVALPIANAGAALGSLIWRNERPGSAAFVGQLWPIVLAFIAIGALTLLVARRLVAANVETAAQAEAALESSRMRAEFISTMSHELRTPLNAIIGYAELIEEEAEEVDEHVGAAIRADAGHVLSAAKHLRQLVDDILDHSRFEAGRVRLVIERLPIDALLAETAELMAPLAAGRANELVFRNEADGHEVIGDDTRVRQCLINLVGNAVKFTKDGAISVTARVDSEDGARIIFDVTDTGIGIEPDLLEKLFEPFVQAKAASHSTYGGAGLGLSISRKLARAMGGDIGVASEVGRGSIFSLILPAAQSAVAHRAAA